MQVHRLILLWKRQSSPIACLVKYEFLQISVDDHPNEINNPAMDLKYGWGRQRIITFASEKVIKLRLLKNNQ
jgi:hypothetical protein